jgi:ligand-binding SRPBCC domain-containing protein
MSSSILSHTRLDDGAFCLEAECVLPLPIDEVFDFFQDAHNLEALTPPFLKFQVLTPRPIEMHAGTLIDYKLKLHGIPIRWRTQILEWNPPHGFVDDQLKGPYRQWHHTHRFEPVEGGTRCTDRVLYRVPGGALIQKWFVGPDVERIFRFRGEQMMAILAPYADNGSESTVE